MPRITGQIEISRADLTALSHLQSLPSHKRPLRVRVAVPLGANAARVTKVLLLRSPAELHVLGGAFCSLVSIESSRLSQPGLYTHNAAPFFHGQPLAIREQHSLHSYGFKTWPRKLQKT